MASPDQFCDVHILHATAEENLARHRVGMGFLIGPRHVLTCAHVVQAALADGRDRRDDAATPEQPVRLAFAFSRLAAREPIEATVCGWWPVRSSVRNWTGLDDVALLRLPDAVCLPDDVTHARQGPSAERGMRGYGNGVSDGAPEGLNFDGEVRGPVVGNRWSLRTAGGDDRIVEGCSGAAIQHADGVIGMVAERQQTQTGLFIRTQHLLENPQIMAAWAPRSFVGDRPGALGGTKNSVAGDDEEWARMSIASRLEAHLSLCDREPFWRRLDTAMRPTSIDRRPVIGVFAGHDDDLPKRLHDRYEIQFLVEAGIATRGQVVRPPKKWGPKDLDWRAPGQAADKAMAQMKRGVIEFIGARDSEAASIRDALKVGRSQVFYTEIDGAQIDGRDIRLMTEWAAYWAEVGKVSLARSVVHLIRVKPTARDAQKPRLAASRLEDLTKRAGDIVVNLGALPGLESEDLRRWIDDIAPHAQLNGETVFRLRGRASESLDFSAGPRLRRLEEWLFKLEDGDIR